MRAPMSQKLEPFGTTIFSEMSRLAAEHGAINLSQGFPDFDGPQLAIEHVARAMREGHNQYARSMGHPELVQSICTIEQAAHGLSYDPMQEVVVTSGATECIASSLIGLLDPGDEVILFEPYYDSYPAAVAMAGGGAKFYTLRFPDFAIDEAELEALFSPRTKLLVLNNPHNPSGKVFSKAELEIISGLCIAHDVIVISDEVYEHLVYDDAKHIPIASLPGMRERTLTISSAGKTYSFTGWKVGWGLGPNEIVRAVQAAHQFVTFSTATPIQVGLARAMTELGTDYFEVLRQEYVDRRDFLVDVLDAIGFDVATPRGTYFVLADFRALFAGDDQAFARHLIEAVGVAAIPPSVFYSQTPREGRHLIRFAYCKQMKTLEAAAERLYALGRAAS